MVMVESIYDKFGVKLMATEFPTRRPWSEKFMRGYKLTMVFIKKQKFVVTIQVLKHWFGDGRYT